MVTIFINKVLLLLLVMSILVCIRNGFFLVQSWITSGSDEPRRILLSRRELWILSLSIGYIVVSLVTGITV